MEYIKPIRIEICLTPKACPRPRVTKFGHCYMPKDYKDWCHAVALIANSQYKGLPIQDCAIDLVFVHKRPKSKRGKPTQRLPRCAKPDLDNQIKGILDALQAARILEDDRFIFKITAVQWYGPMDALPTMEITILPLKKAKKRL